MCLPVVLKDVFGEFDEAMFEGDERPCELTFYILVIRISEMNKIAEMKFQVGELIICFLVGLSKRLF
jgi:hypothetical protein